MPQRLIELVTSHTSTGLAAGLAAAVVQHVDRSQDVVVRDDGLRIAAPPLMLLGLAARLDDVRFERAAEDAWHLRLVTPPQAAEYLQHIAAPGRRGVGQDAPLARGVAGRRRPAQSGLEIEVAKRRSRSGSPGTRPAASR